MEVEKISLTRSELKKALIRAGGDAILEFSKAGSKDEKKTEMDSYFMIFATIISAQIAKNAEEILFDKED